MKYILSAYMVLLLLLTIPGCWDLRELDETGLVLLMGIDYPQQGDGFEVTVHIHTPLQSSSQGQEDASPSGQAVRVITSRGQTVMDAFRNMRSQTSFQLSFQHARLIVVGEDLARKGLTPVLDHMLRTREVRFNSLLMVCQGSARDFLQTPPMVSASLSEELEGILRNEEAWSKSHSVEVYRFVQDLLDPGIQPVASRLLTIQPQHDQAPNPQGEENDETNSEDGVVLIQGISVFNDDKLVDWLTGTETIGYRYLTGQGGQMVLNIPWRGGIASMEVDMATCVKDVVFSESGPTIKIVLFLSADLTEYTGYADLKQQGVAEELHQLAAGQLAQLFQTTDEKAKEMGVDFLGYGGIISRKYPKQWTKLNTRWREIFPQVKTTFDIRLDMLQPGTITEPLPR